MKEGGYMRMIDAEELKQCYAGTNGIDDKASYASIGAIIDLQPTVITGKVKEAKFAYQKITSIKPTEHHYEELGEKPYIKYSCPVCQAVGNLHQVTSGDKNCPLCNVNLCWETDN